MRKTMKRLYGALICIALIGVAFLIPSHVDAAPVMGDEIYEDLALLSNYSGCTSMQGMAVSDKYVYAIHVRSDNTRAVMQCVDIETGEVRLITDSATGKKYFSDWGHANDMEARTVDGVDYLYVSGNKGIMVYEVDNFELTLITTYQVMLANQKFFPGGLSIYDVDDTHITFLCKNGFQLYTAKATIGVEHEEIPAKTIARLDVSKVNVNGREMDLSSFVAQGMHFRDNVLYFITTGCYAVETINHSVILGYYMGNTTLPLQPEPDLIYYIISDIRSGCFEMEGCGISPDGRLFFNTNSVSYLAGYDRDGIHVLKEDIFSRPHGGRKTYTIRFDANGGTGEMEEITATYERKTFLPACTFTREGRVFDGWQIYREAKGEWLYTNGKDTDWYKEENVPEGYTKYTYAETATLFDCTDIDGDAVILYPKWRTFGYRIRFDENGGRGLMGDQLLKVGESVPLDLNKYTNPDGIFLGWTARRKSDGTVYGVNVADATDKKWVDEDAIGKDYALYVFADGEEITDLCFIDGDRAEFKAQWAWHGDVDGNGEVNVSDVMRLVCYADGVYPISEDRMSVLDLNGDGAVNLADALYLVLYMGGGLEKLPGMN